MYLSCAIISDCLSSWHQIDDNFKERDQQRCLFLVWHLFSVNFFVFMICALFSINIEHKTDEPIMLWLCAKISHCKSQLLSGQSFCSIRWMAFSLLDETWFYQGTMTPTKEMKADMEVLCLQTCAFLSKFHRLLTWQNPFDVEVFFIGAKIMITISVIPPYLIVIQINGHLFLQFI